MQFRILSVPPRARILVAALPDMGNVAGIAMEHLIKKLGLSVFAEAVGDWPPFVAHEASLISYERGGFYFYARDGLSFVSMTGTHQPPDPASLYQLCESVLDVAQSLGVGRIYTLGAAHTGEEYIEEPRVFFAVTSKSLIDEVSALGSVPLESSGYITGFNGLLLGLAKNRGLEGVCLLGEISDPQVRQPHAAKAVLTMLGRALNISLSFEELDEEIERARRAKSIERILRRRDRPPGVM